MQINGVITKTGKRVFITYFDTHFIEVRGEHDLFSCELKRGDVSISERELMKIALYGIKEKL